MQPESKIIPKMNILLTNDDGFDAPGINILAEALSSHNLWIVAPDKERSGFSHSITLRDPVRMKEVEPQRIRCSGTPADCVLFGVLGVLPEKPDLILSGINHGPNLGTDIIYSGTAAAARQGALMGIPSVAVSVTNPDDKDAFYHGAEFIAQNLQKLVTLGSQDDFININVPGKIDMDSPVQITHPSRRIYNDKLERFKSPDGADYLFLTGTVSEDNIPKESDFGAVRQGRISVSPIYLYPVNNQLEDEFEHAGLTYREVDGRVS